MTAFLEGHGGVEMLRIFFECCSHGKNLQSFTFRKGREESLLILGELSRAMRGR